jgi:hypothetical protein
MSEEEDSTVTSESSYEDTLPDD